jgi:hypothetical protein
VRVERNCASKGTNCYLGVCERARAWCYYERTGGRADGVSGSFVCNPSRRLIPLAQLWVGAGSVSVSLQQAAVHAFFASDAFFTHTPQKQAQINCIGVYSAQLSARRHYFAIAFISIRHFSCGQMRSIAARLGWLGAKFDSIPEPLNHLKRARAERLDMNVNIHETTWSR